MVKIEELIVQAKSGNKEAYSELILFVQEDLYKVAKAKLNNEEDIQDVLQNTVLNAYINIDKLRDNKYFKTWITRILINECNGIYRKINRDTEIFEKYTKNNFSEEYSDEIADFDNLIKSLDENKRKIFELYYKENLSIKQIAQILNISETTVKASLNRGRQKLKETLKHISFFVIVLFIFITTTVIAISIINYIKNLFEINSIGASNDGVLMAIENMNWYQEVDMDYIELGDGYKIKAEYLLMDEMNLYIIFDFESEKDISKYKNIAIPDLNITNEKDEIICNLGDIPSNQIEVYAGDKLIEKDNHHMKVLVYIYTNSFPKSKILNIDFKTINIYASKKDNILNTKAKFEIKLDEKFINRNYIEYKSDSENIEKAIITETGFYIIFETDKEKLREVHIKDEYNNTYNCEIYPISDNKEEAEYEYIIIAQINSEDTNIITLKIDNEEIALYKEN